MHDKKDIPLLPELAGEAAPGAYGFRTDKGEPVDPDLAVFPIVKYVDGKVHLIGTGFFITTHGIFVTAKHVLMDPFDRDGRERYPIGIIQFAPGDIYYQRPILRCAFHPVADVTVGVAQMMYHNRTGQPLTNPVLSLDRGITPIGTPVMTYAYPKHTNIIESEFQRVELKPNYYDGYVQDYLPNGRDKTFLPGPCYQTNIHIHGGASGGPVCGPHGRVFGVNSTGIGGTNISHVSVVTSILDLTIDEVSMDGLPARSVRVSEMARTGHIIVLP
jgi:hypothetical protein